MSEHNSNNHAELRALQVKVGGIDNDIRDINDRIVGLDQKLEKSFTALGSEFRTALSNLGGQLSERNRTPWAILISAAGFISATLGFIGNQALEPLRVDIKTVKEQIVPRAEIDNRVHTTLGRLERLENLANTLASRRYDEMQRQIDRLERQNDSLKSSQR